MDPTRFRVTFAPYYCEWFRALTNGVVKSLSESGVQKLLELCIEDLIILLLCITSLGAGGNEGLVAFCQSPRRSWLSSKPVVTWPTIQCFRY